jgi:hypothetical protein
LYSVDSDSSRPPLRWMLRSQLASEASRATDSRTDPANSQRQSCAGSAGQGTGAGGVCVQGCGSWPGGDG